MISPMQRPYPGAAAAVRRKAVRWSPLGSLVNRFRTRPEVASLGALSDRQLADIGLMRGDLPRSLNGGPSNDHSRESVRTALLRRTSINLL